MSKASEEAPMISTGYPYKRRLYPVWQSVWNELRASPDEFRDGWDLAISAVEGTTLAPVTLVAVIRRAANAGLLEREERPVKVKILNGEGTRKRMFYRIKDEA